MVKSSNRATMNGKKQLTNGIRISGTEGLGTSYREFLKRFGSTATPDEFLDKHLPDLTHSEAKVFLYILRHTLGYSKKTDAISNSQFLNGVRTKEGKVIDRGTGVKTLRTLRVAIKSLVSKNLIFRQPRQAMNGRTLSWRYGLNFVQDTRVKPKIRTFKFNPSPEQYTGGGYQSVPPTINNSEGIHKQRCLKSTTRKKLHKPREQIDYLIDEIEKVTGDRHSRGGFAKIAIHLADDRIFQLLAELKDQVNVRNRGAWFIATAKKSLKTPIFNADSPKTPPPPTQLTQISTPTASNCYQDTSTPTEPVQAGEILQTRLAHLFQTRPNFMVKPKPT